MRFSHLLAAAAGLVSAAEALVTVGYYPSWNESAVEGADLSPYSHINIAFGIPTTEGGIYYDESLFAPIVGKIHAHGAKAIFSIGGWTGSANFSDILKDQAKTAKFTTTLVSWVKKHNLDGLDFDWEYPGRGGNTCNIFDAAHDTDNFLTFLTTLRKQLDAHYGPKRKAITLAVAVTPFQGPNGTLTDVSPFARVVDFINLMQYDINGLWNPQTGPNAPLNFEAGKLAQVSFASAIDAWTGAGFPARQLVAGLAFYGRSAKALVNMALEPTNQYQNQSQVVVKGDRDDIIATDECAGTTGYSGVWKYKNLRTEGPLKGPTTTGSGWQRQLDPVSQTPWLFNTQSMVFISYDDVVSIGKKAQYAKKKGLAGVMVWSLDNDYHNELINAAKVNWGGYY